MNTHTGERSHIRFEVSLSVVERETLFNTFEKEHKATGKFSKIFEGLG